MRFFLLDRITHLEPGTSISGIKAWSLDNQVFLDHFPGEPIVPGVLLTESMAQLIGVLIDKSYNHVFPDSGKVYPILSIIQKAKFRSLVRPGDQTIIKATLKSLDRYRAVGIAKLYVDEELKAEATLSFTIGHEDVMENNPFTSKREEYLHILLKDL